MCERLSFIIALHTCRAALHLLTMHRIAHNVGGITLRCSIEMTSNNMVWWGGGNGGGKEDNEC